MISTTSAERLSPLERCNQYAQDVLSGAILACEKVKLAAQRYLDDLEKAKSDSYPWTFDPERAKRAPTFMELFLRPMTGKAERLVLMPWECFVECQIYGWVDKKTRLRRFREALIVIGQGNGKSTLVAGNATYGACKDGERGAEIDLLANTKSQAGNVFDECKAQIRASPELSRRFRPLRDGIFYDAANATIKARANDSENIDGLKPYYGIFDELWAYRTFELINVIKGKTIKREQPLLFYITTMGTVLDGPLVQYYVLFSDALIEGKLKPEVADRMFTFICELDAQDDIEDSRLWVKANPSLGVTMKLEDLVNKWETVKLVPSERANFITKQLNIMVNADEMAFVGPEIIKRNKDTYPPESLLGRRCYGGFDLSEREDFTAAALLFPLDDGRLFVLQHTWVPRRKVELDNEKIDYYGLAMRGDLSIVEGEYIQQEDVYDWFVKQAELYEIQTIGYDPANAVRLRQMLEAKGFDLQIVRQGPMTLNEPMKDLKERLLDGSIVHNNDPLFNWYLSNVHLSNERRHTDRDNWMPTKHNKYRKIDGFMAFLDAHTVYLDKNPVTGAPVPEFRVYDF